MPALFAGAFASWGREVDDGSDPVLSD
jgi:hypothetical protein